MVDGQDPRTEQGPDRPRDSDRSPDPGHSSLEALDTRLRARRARQDGQDRRVLYRPSSVPASAWGLAWRLAIEMAAALVFGIGAGWLLDDALGTKPVFLLILAFLGIASGIWNVLRVTRRYQALQDAAEAPRSGAQKEPE